MQITIWGTGDDGESEVHDYANKEWAGLMQSFYKGRCGISVQACVLHVDKSTPVLIFVLKSMTGDVLCTGFDKNHPLSITRHPLVWIPTAESGFFDCHCLHVTAPHFLIIQMAIPSMILSTGGLREPGHEIILMFRLLPICESQSWLQTLRIARPELCHRNCCDHPAAHQE